MQCTGLVLSRTHKLTAWATPRTESTIHPLYMLVPSPARGCPSLPAAALATPTLQPRLQTRLRPATRLVC